MSLKLLTEHHLEFLSLKEAAQACPSLHLSKCHIVGNHMSRLIYLILVCGNVKLWLLIWTIYDLISFIVYFSSLLAARKYEIFNNLTSVDSDEPLHPHFKLRNSKWCSVSSLTIIFKNIQATSKGSDQTARMRRLIWGFAGCTYHIVGNLMHWLICNEYKMLCSAQHRVLKINVLSIWTSNELPF